MPERVINNIFRKMLTNEQIMDLISYEQNISPLLVNIIEIQDDKIIYDTFQTELDEIIDDNYDKILERYYKLYRIRDGFWHGAVR